MVVRNDEKPRLSPHTMDMLGKMEKAFKNGGMKGLADVLPQLIFDSRVDAVRKGDVERLRESLEKSSIRVSELDVLLKYSARSIYRVKRAISEMTECNGESAVPEEWQDGLRRAEQINRMLLEKGAHPSQNSWDPETDD